MNKENAVYRPSKNVAFRKIDGRIVIVNTGENSIVQLNETGTATWERLDGRTVKQVAEQIAQEFQIDQMQASIDIIEFLEYLKARNFVESEKG